MLNNQVEVDNRSSECISWSKLCSLWVWFKNKLKRVVKNNGWSDLMGFHQNWNKAKSGLSSQIPSNTCNNQTKLEIDLYVGCRRNCQANLGINQKILCVSCRCNCWVVLIKWQQETWSCNFWVVFVTKQKETCCVCCWIQNNWVHLRCRSCWDVSQFCSQSSGDSIEEGQRIVASCNPWDIKLRETWCWDCGDVIWDRKLLELCRTIIWDRMLLELCMAVVWDRKLYESRAVIWDRKNQTFFFVDLRLFTNSWLEWIEINLAWHLWALKSLYT